MKPDALISTNHQILSNIRILDFGRVLAGPYATRLLADFGAEVVKVESLSADAQDKFSLGYNATWNRNKLSISLDLNKLEGIEIARKLVRISDIVIENFSPRVMDNWELGYPELKKLKPDVIMLSLSVMGHTGPWRDYTGFGPTIQAFSGITHLTAYKDQSPLGIGYSYADHIAGLYACLALLGALEYRRKTGQGQYIDLSQTEEMASLLSSTFMDYILKGEEAKPVGNSSSKASPHGVYPCRGQDRWCAIAVFDDEEWEGFKRAVGNPFWVNAERFATPDTRLKNTAALDNLVEEWTRQYSAEEVMNKLQKEGVPAGVVQNAADLASDPQLRSQGFFLEIDHPILGRTVTDASPIRLSDNPAKYRRAAPVHGQDNDYVYRQLLGLTGDEIKKLKEDRVI